MTTTKMLLVMMIQKARLKMAQEILSMITKKSTGMRISMRTTIGMLTMLTNMTTITGIKINEKLISPFGLYLNFEFYGYLSTSLPCIC